MGLDYYCGKRKAASTVMPRRVPCARVWPVVKGGGRSDQRPLSSAARCFWQFCFLKALLCGEMSPVNMRLERQISWRGARGFEDLYFDSHLQHLILSVRSHSDFGSNKT